MPSQQPVPRSQPRQLHPPDIEIIDEVQVVDYGESVGSHVASHIDPSDIAQHAQQLGSQLKQKSSLTEQRIHQKFDHDVGQLGADRIPDRQELTSEPSYADQDEIPEISRDILRLFRSPSNIRQALIMNEILNRPEWD